jgi:hypothetical protein
VIAAQHLHTAVHSEEQLAALETAELSEPVTVWMKLDTGMHVWACARKRPSVLSASEPVQKRPPAGEYRQPLRPCR